MGTGGSADDTGQLQNTFFHRMTVNAKAEKSSIVILQGNVADILCCDCDSEAHVCLRGRSSTRNIERQSSRLSIRGLAVTRRSPRALRPNSISARMEDQFKEMKC
jgi:hypothetical protein